MNVLLKGCVVAKLLLIEDEVGVQEYFKAVVSRMGHKLKTTSSFVIFSSKAFKCWSLDSA